MYLIFELCLHPVGGQPKPCALNNAQFLRLTINDSQPIRVHVELARPKPNAWYAVNGDRWTGNARSLRMDRNLQICMGITSNASRQV